jgi:hypothetical protein
MLTLAGDSVYFGATTDEAQLLLALALGLSTVVSVWMSLETRADQIRALERQNELDARQAELDHRTVPLQESLNIIATDLRLLREGPFQALVEELRALRSGGADSED